MFIIKYKNFFIGISVVLMIASVAAVLVWGIRYGIDFTGGSITEVEFSANTSTVTATSTAPTTTPVAVASTRPEIEELKSVLSPLSTSTAETIIQPTGEKGYIIRSKHLSEGDHAKVISALSLGGKWNVTEKRFNTIGPVVGEELRNKAWVSIFAVMLAIVLFVAFVFRKVSHPVPSWQFGIITLIALFHDVVVPVGVIAALGHFTGAEVDVLFVTALLTVLGFSVHDTIVVFDRVRENLKLKVSNDFSETVGKSLQQTFVRSVNTSLTVILVLIALLILGPASIHLFSLMLLVGIIAGVYSSIFLASPLLVVAEKIRRGK